MIQYEKVFHLTKNLSILYVEDDTSLILETNEIFENLFSIVDISLNGKDALKKYNSFYTQNNKCYDIVVTDISMPKMDGIELTKEIYKINPNQAIIVISAHSEPEYLIELVNIGIEQFLIKPYNYETILNILFKTSQKIILQQNKKNELETISVTLNKNYTWNKKESNLLKNNNIISLTKNETILMELFIKNKYKITTIEEIFTFIWGDNQHLASTETLKSIISRLRKKIPELTIENTYGLGYRLTF